MSAVAHVFEQKPLGFKHVLIATDFSPSSERAGEWALAIARRYSSQVTLVHALAPEPREPVPIDSPRELDRERFKAEQQIKQLAEKTASNGISCRMRVQRGRVWDVLSPLIQHKNTDLLVLGTHGRAGIKKVALGSIAEEVLRQATCPVLTIGPNVGAAGSADFHRVLFATDFGSASVKAFPYALSLAEGQGGKLVLVHMFPLLPSLAAASYAPAVCAAKEVIDWQAAAKQDSLKKLKELAAQGARLAVPPEYVVGTDFLPEGILTTAAQHDVDLIVMGANRADSARIASHIPSGLTYHVISQARCPVLSVRA